MNHDTLIPHSHNPQPNQVKIIIDIFPSTGTPEFFYYLGWHDLRATQEKLILKRRGFLINWTTLKEDLESLFQEKACPNPFYEIGIDDAMDVAGREPMKLIDPYHLHTKAVPWQAPSFNRTTYRKQGDAYLPVFVKQPGTDVCSTCKKESSTFLYAEEGPAFNGIFCSEVCLNRRLARYLEEDNMVAVFVRGQIERPIVTFDLGKTKLRELFAKLPEQSVLVPKPAVSQTAAPLGFDFS